jgi:hypothetical protein
MIDPIAWLAFTAAMVLWPGLPRPGSSGSPGEHTGVGTVLPCWISSAPGPSGFKEVIVGAARGRVDYNGAPGVAGSVPVALAWWDDPPGVADCPMDNDAGSIEQGKLINFRLQSWYASDRSKVVGGDLTFTFAGTVWDDACYWGMPITPTVVKTWTHSFTVPERDWIEADRFDTNGSSSGRGILVAAPPVGVTHSFRYAVSVDIAAIGDDSPLLSAATGCINFTGVP